MSRVGVRHLIQSKLRYINGHRFTFAVHLIANRYRGCVYVLTSRYEEYYKDKTLIVVPDELNFTSNDSYLSYDSSMITIKLDKCYYYDKHVFNIDDSNKVFGISLSGPNTWQVMGRDITLKFALSEPDNLWKSIQELALWFKTNPVPANAWLKLTD